MDFLIVGGHAWGKNTSLLFLEYSFKKPYTSCFLSNMERKINIQMHEAKPSIDQGQGPWNLFLSSLILKMSVAMWGRI